MLDTNLKISNIDLGIDLSDNHKPKKTEQRTDDWFEKRAGSWTGSKIKNIMSCNRSASKMSWSDSDKVYEFSTGIVKYIYERAMERKTGKYTTSKGNASTNYGNVVERFIMKIGEELIDAKIDEVGYKEFPNLKKAGASSDGICKEHKAVIEIKACTNWQTHYDRTFSNTDEKSIDFWQTQAEMYAWGYDKCFYLVAEPPKDIMEYLTHPEAEELLNDTFDGNIEELELFEKFKKECAVNVEEIKASKFHQKAMIERIKICELVCSVWIKQGGNLEDLFWQIVDQSKGGAFLSETAKSTNDNSLEVASVNEIEVNNHSVVNNPEGILIHKGNVDAICEIHNSNLKSSYDSDSKSSYENVPF